MKRLGLVFLLLFSLLPGCNRHQETIALAPGTQVALLLIDTDLQGIALHEWKEMQRVEAWMRRDLLTQLGNAGIFATSLTDMKEYNSAMGVMIIINVQQFYGGNFPGRPRRNPASGPASLEIGYKILDERGALLAAWQDGVTSIKDGTNCAETLNRRFVQRLLSVLTTKK